MNRPLLTLCLALLLPAGAIAGDPAFEPAAYWTVAFGGQQPLSAGYGLALRHRLVDEAAPASVAQLDVSDAGLVASLAGVTLTRDLRVEQAEDGAEPGATEGLQPRPWYATRWVWWTGLGVAAGVAVLAGSDSAGDSEAANDPSQPGGGQGGAQGGFLCSEDECVIPCSDNPFGINTCNSGLVGRAERVAEAGAEPSWLLQGSGQMGDLLAE